MNSNWQTKKLGEICDFEGGSQPPKSNFIFSPKKGYIRFLQIRDFGNDKHITYIPESKKNRLCNEDDILLGRYGASVGKVLVNKKGAYNVAVMKTMPKLDILNKKYFFYYLISDSFQKRLSKVAARSAQAGFSKDDIYDFPILTPSLPEQHRIVKILDEVFEKIEIAKLNTEKNLKNAKELLESYINSIFSNQKGNWNSEVLKNLTLKIGSGATPRGGRESYKKEGFFLIRSMNVYDRCFIKKNLAYIDKKQADDLSNVTLQIGDILLNITGGSIARCCILPEEFLPARVNQHVSIIRPKQTIIDTTFLNYLLTSKFYKDQLLKIGEQGATRQAITKAQLEEFVIAYPKSISEQKSIVTRLDALSAETKKLETIYTQKLADLEELKKSILKLAFSGEL